MAPRAALLSLPPASAQPPGKGAPGCPHSAGEDTELTHLWAGTSRTPRCTGLHGRADVDQDVRCHPIVDLQGPLGDGSRTLTW